MSFTNARIVGREVNPVDYFKQEASRGTADYAMSSSLLRNFGECPARFLGGYEPPESKAKEFGRLLDCLILTPGQFSARYAIQPAEYESDDGPKKWNNNAKVCRAWTLEQAERGLEVVTNSDMLEAESAMKRLRADDILNSFLAASDCQIWVEGEWQDEPTGLAIPCRCLIDCVPRLDTEWAKCLGDLKTTRNASIPAWQRWCFQAGYHVQAAFNRALYVAATGEDRPSFCFIVQENFLPWEPARRLMSEDFMALGTAASTTLMSNYCQCLKNGKWPSYDDTDESVQGWTLVQPEPFMSERAAFAPRFNFDEEENEDD